MLELRYLQTDANCWFDTGIIPNINTKVQIKASLENTNIDWPGVIGAQNSNDAPSSFQIRGNGRDEMLCSSIGNKTYGGPSIVWGTMYDLELSTNGWYVDNTLITVISPTTFDTCNYTIFLGAVHNNQGAFRPGKVKIGRTKIYQNNVLVGEFIPAYDENNVVCFYDSVSQTYKYNLGGGTPTAGPVAHTFESSVYAIRYASSGGSSSFTVTAQTGWTCTVPSAFTFSTTSGESGTTTITITATVNSGSSKIEETIIFTDDDSYTFNVKITQKGVSTGGSSIYMGDENMTAIYFGGEAIEIIYIGEQQIFSPVSQSATEIWYTSTSGQTVDPNLTSSDLTLVSNTYVDGKGVMVFNSAVTISSSMFNGASGLTTITLPEQVTIFNWSAFRGCSNLTKIKLINKRNITCDNYAFRDCGSLTKLSFDRRITNIPNSLMQGCASLTSFTISNSATTISTEAFKGCTSLTSMYIPSNITYIRQEAFMNCSNILLYDFSDFLTVPTLEHENAFDGINQNCKIKVPYNLYDTWITTGAWSAMTDYITGRPTAEDGTLIAIYNVASTTSPITILGNTGIFSSMSVDGGSEESVTSTYQFSTTGQHTIVYNLISSDVSLPRAAFDSNTNLIEVYMGEGVTSINDDSYADCTNLQYIYWPNSIRSTSVRAVLHNTTSLEEMGGYNVVDNKYYIRNSELWFMGCGISGVVDLSQTNITSIRHYAAFGDFPYMTKVILPATLTNMNDGGNGAVWGNNCPLLTEIVSYATTCPTNRGTFGNVPNGGTIKVPVGSIASYQAGFPALVEKGWTFEEMS